MRTRSRRGRPPWCCALLVFAAALPAPAHAFGISTTTAIIAGGACVGAALIGIAIAVVYYLVKRSKSVQPNAAQQKANELEEGQQQQQQTRALPPQLDDPQQQKQQQDRALDGEDDTSQAMYAYSGTTPPKIHEDTGAWLTPVLDDAYDKYAPERFPSRSVGSYGGTPAGLSAGAWSANASYTASGQQQARAPGPGLKAYPPVPPLHPGAAANSAAVAEGEQGRSLSPSSLPVGSATALGGAGAGQRGPQALRPPQQQQRPVGWVASQ